MNVTRFEDAYFQVFKGVKVQGREKGKTTATKKGGRAKTSPLSCLSLKAHRLVAVWFQGWNAGWSAAKPKRPSRDSRAGSCWA